MEQTTGSKVKLGLFISIGIALFIVGIYFIGQKQQLFNSTFRISGIFKDISGLQVGNNVRFCGIDVGIIEDIHLVTDSTVRVDMLIDEDTRKFMKKNAKATIGSDGLMGNKILIVIPGTANANVLSNNDMIQTVQPVNMDDILGKVKVSSDNLASITDDLSAIMKNIRQGKGTVGKLFMDTVFAQNIDKTIVNIKQGAGGFKQNMDAASHSFLLRGFLKKKKKEDEKRDEKVKEEDKKKKDKKKKE